MQLQLLHPSHPIASPRAPLHSRGDRYADRSHLAGEAGKERHAMGNCCSDEMGHGAGRHSVGPAASVAEASSYAAADRFLRSRGAGASTQIEVRSPGHCTVNLLHLRFRSPSVGCGGVVVALRGAVRCFGASVLVQLVHGEGRSCSCLCLA